MWREGDSNSRRPLPLDLKSSTYNRS